MPMTLRRDFEMSSAWSLCSYGKFFHETQVGNARLLGGVKLYHCPSITNIDTLGIEIEAPPSLLWTSHPTHFHSLLLTQPLVGLILLCISNKLRAPRCSTQ